MTKCKSILTPTTKEHKICHALATTSAFNLKLCHITLKFVNYRAWMEVKHWIYLVSKIFSYSAWCRDINCISRWESFGNIIKHFSSSFLQSSTIRWYYVCSQYFNDLRKIIKNSIKESRVTPGHYSCPLKNINLFIFSYKYVWVIFRIFWQLLKILVSYFEV